MSRIILYVKVKFRALQPGWRKFITVSFCFLRFYFLLKRHTEYSETSVNVKKFNSIFVEIPPAKLIKEFIMQTAYKENHKRSQHSILGCTLVRWKGPEGQKSTLCE